MQSSSANFLNLMRRPSVAFTDHRNDHVAFPERSLLWQCPASVQWRVYDNAIDGGPTLRDEHGAAPSEFVVSAIRNGPSGVTTASITTITNKAVIAALLLTFNYGAVSTAAQQDDTTVLFQTYFFCQMTSVVLAFCVMLSAATFTSHISRCGQQATSVIRYLRQASWIDRRLNEPFFVAQCFFTMLALILEVALTYHYSVMLYVFIGMVAGSGLVLTFAHVWSLWVHHRVARAEWEEVVRAEEDFRAWMMLRRQRADRDDVSCPIFGAEVSAKSSSRGRDSDSSQTRGVNGTTTQLAAGGQLHATAIAGGAGGHQRGDAGARVAAA